MVDDVLGTIHIFFCAMVAYRVSVVVYGNILAKRELVSGDTTDRIQYHHHDTYDNHRNIPRLVRSH